MATGLKFRSIEVEGLYYVAKTKVLISICAFDFAYAKGRFSHEAAHMIFKTEFSSNYCYTVKSNNTLVDLSMLPSMGKGSEVSFLLTI